MVNQLNSGSLDTLKSGQTLLVNARKVANGKIQLEFAEIINDGRPVNFLGMFNKSDERFASTKPRRAWESVMPTDASALLGVDLTDDSKYIPDSRGNDVMELNILNPEVDGTPIRVQVVETTEGTEWDMNNIETRAKRRGRDGDFIYHNGKYIFTKSSATLGEPQNVFLEADKVAAPDVIQVDATTGEIFS